MILSLKKVLNNKKLRFSVVSQVLTLLVSVLMTVGVTKFISVESYGYWQLFIFYSSYIGLAHFGICDGLYLLYGGKKMEELDKSEIKGSFSVFIIIQFIIAFSVFIYATFFEIDSQRIIILQVISFVLMISNSQIFFGYILLSTDRIVEYSKSIFTEKVLLLLLIGTAMMLNQLSLKVLICSFAISKVASLLYLLTFYKSVFYQKSIISGRLVLNLVKIGGTLMISNIISTLILGIARYFIDKNWDIEIFGKISLSISLVYFVLVLLAQISFLLFPYLRNSSEESQKQVFIKLNSIISLILKISVILYFPLIYFLNYFLPDYSESIHYLILLLPLCLYDGKMQILYASYFKNLFLQKKLLYINSLSFTVSLIISLIGSYVFKDINVILLGIVFSIILRSIISELILQKIYELRDVKVLILDLVFSIIIISYFFLPFNVYLLIGILLIITALSFNKKLVLNS